MPPKDASSAAGSATDGPKLTDNDVRVLSLAWQCFKTMPAVDTAKLATLAGYKTAASANTAFCNAKKKLLGDVKLPPAGEKAEKATPAGKKGKKAVSTASEVDGGGGGDDDEEVAVEEQTPAKKKRGGVGRATAGRKRKVDVDAEEGDGDGEGEDEIDAPKKKKAKAPQTNKKQNKNKKLVVKDVTSDGDDEGQAGETVAVAVKSEAAAVIKSEQVDDDKSVSMEISDPSVEGGEDVRASIEGREEVTGGVV